MLIRNIHVKNFRSILNERLPCDSLTALVGRNGSGKSSFLSALGLFYNPNARVTPEDFYAEDVTEDIEIAVTYWDFNEEVKDFFSAYIDNESLTVVRVISDPQAGMSGTYHGMGLQHRGFVEIRNAGSAVAIKEKYGEIRESRGYASLPSVTSAGAARTEMDTWETQNREQCTRLRDDGQFFGFTQVAQGYLGRYTKFIHVPAVRDAQEDATEKKGSSVTEIMDLVVRSALAKRGDVSEFEKRTQDQYRKLLDPKKLTELDVLASEMSTTLQSYVPDAKVLLQWSEIMDMVIPMPQVEVKLIEDEYESRVEGTGHGLQRAFIITMLQHLDAVKYVEQVPNGESSVGNEPESTAGPQLPNLVLAIEEPELYQHPSRQRHLASVLLNLAKGSIPGVAVNTQVIYATHSPLFVGLDRFDQIRVLRKVRQADGRPKATQLKKADMEAVANELWDAVGRQGDTFTAQTLKPRLQSMMAPWMGEGFFADVVVLVEGEDDRAAILAVAKSMHLDFEASGTTVIPCFGKNNMDRPLVILRQLGIPVYLVWDGDGESDSTNSEANRRLLRLLGKPAQDWPDFVGPSAACFEVTLEKTLEDEMGGESFRAWLSEAQQKFGIPKKKHALKNPAIIQFVVEKAASSGKTSESLTRIIQNIVALESDLAPENALDFE